MTMGTGQSHSGICADRFIEEAAETSFGSKREQHSYDIDKYETDYKNRGYSKRQYSSELGIQQCQCSNPSPKVVSPYFWTRKFLN